MSMPNLFPHTPSVKGDVLTKSWPYHSNDRHQQVMLCMAGNKDSLRGYFKFSYVGLHLFKSVASEM